MTLLKTLLYGLISGITEILPVSSSGHQAVFRKVFGESEHFGIYNIFIHIGILLALIYTCKPLFRTIGAAKTRSANRNRISHNRRIVKDATPAFVIVSLALIFFCSTNLSLIWIAALFVINGFILFLPQYIAQGNKDGRSMSVLDSVLIGFTGALSAFPGLSRIASTTTVVSVRGGDVHHGVIWSLALSVPAMIILIFADIYAAINLGISFYFSQFFHYLIAFAGAFCGCYLAVGALRRLAKTIGLAVLSYYCWGMAILTFILFLMV